MPTAPKASPSEYIGRFAPSPTGELHFGSLVAAVASYLDARRHSGKWLIRMEDLDPPRVVEGSAERILADLSGFAMRHDDEVVFQSNRTSAYLDALNVLRDRGLVFDCACTRAELKGLPAYPGTCRQGVPGGREPRAVRFAVDQQRICFTDRIQGPQEVSLAAEGGDFVVWRADGLPAYQLAVVVDDGWQGVSDVVRGTDLLDSTGRQIALQRALGLPQPRYAHVPLVTREDGTKLSKQYRSDPVRNLPAEGALRAALEFLGHPPPTGLGLPAMWEWAITNVRLEQARTVQT